MKKITLILLFVCGGLFAQEVSKVGTIDIDFILSNMPELENVKKQTEDYSKSLEVDLNKKVVALEEALAAYQKEEATLTINQRKTRQDSILAMENEMKQFQQKGNQLIILKQEEFLRPLYDKIGTALEKVAQANNYTQILRRNDDVVYVDNRFDLTLAVLLELGIEIKEEE